MKYMKRLSIEIVSAERWYPGSKVEGVYETTTPVEYEDGIFYPAAYVEYRDFSSLDSSGMSRDFVRVGDWVVTDVRGGRRVYGPAHFVSTFALLGDPSDPGKPIYWHCSIGDEHWITLHHSGMGDVGYLIVEDAARIYDQSSLWARARRCWQLFWYSTSSWTEVLLDKETATTLGTELLRLASELPLSQEETLSRFTYRRSKWRRFLSFLDRFDTWQVAQRLLLWGAVLAYLALGFVIFLERVR